MTALFLLLAALLGALGRRLAGGAFQQWTGLDVGDLPIRIAFAALIVAAAFLGGWTPHMLTVLPIGAAGVSVPLAIIPAWCYADLLALRGDQGARALLQRHSPRLLRVDMPAAALDVDTPEDLQALNAPPG